MKSNQHKSLFHILLITILILCLCTLSIQTFYNFTSSFLPNPIIHSSNIPIFVGRLDNETSSHFRSTPQDNGTSPHFMSTPQGNEISSHFMSTPQGNETSSHFMSTPQGNETSSHFMSTPQDNETSSHFMGTVNKRRLNLVHHYCTTWKNKGILQNYITVRPQKKMVLDPLHKLAYCMIPKSGSTNVRRALLAIIRTEVAGKGVAPEDVLPHLDWDSVDKAKEFLNEIGHVNLTDYFKFTFVRHPFERILSAYLDKLKLGAKARTPFFYPFIREMSPSHNISNFTFLEFVTYLANHANISHTFNNHWAKFVDICQPCSIQYHFIGDARHLNEEFNYLLDVVGIKQITFPGEDKAIRRMQEYYATVDEAILKKLYKVYEADFLMFNFSYFHPARE